MLQSILGPVDYHVLGNAASLWEFEDERHEYRENTVVLVHEARIPQRGFKNRRLQKVNALKLRLRWLHYKSMNLLFLALTGVCTWPGTLGYPNGDVASACADMLPLHSPFTPQTSTPPYMVAVNSTTYTPGGTVRVTLMSMESGTYFDGFMLQAQKAGSMGPVGYFTSRNSTPFKLHNCSDTQSSAISHASGDNKMQFEVTWVAPLKPSLGNVEFCATFVKKYDVFWAMVKSRTVLSTASSAPVTLSHLLNSMGLGMLIALGIVFGLFSGTFC